MKNLNGQHRWQTLWDELLGGLAVSSLLTLVESGDDLCSCPDWQLSRSTDPQRPPHLGIASPRLPTEDRTRFRRRGVHYLRYGRAKLAGSPWRLTIHPDLFRYPRSRAAEAPTP